MTKDEAIQAMKDGKKVKHRFFTSHEWMKIRKDGMYHFEDGHVFSAELFWADRYVPWWERDWQIVF